MLIYFKEIGTTLTRRILPGSVCGSTFLFNERSFAIHEWTPNLHLTIPMKKVVK